MSKTPRVFLSYASADRPFAAKLAEGLAKAGVSTFLDYTPAANDEPIFDQTRRELAASDLVVLVVPPREGEGRLALTEVGAARAMDKQILAVLPDKTRYANSSFARALSNSALVDAAELSPSALINAIVSSMPAQAA